MERQKSPDHQRVVESLKIYLVDNRTEFIRAPNEAQHKPATQADAGFSPPE